MKSKGKPRNPFVALAKFRKAGSHAKPVKSLRRHEKQALTNYKLSINLSSSFVCRNRDASTRAISVITVTPRSL